MQTWTHSWTNYINNPCGKLAITRVTVSSIPTTPHMTDNLEYGWMNIIYTVRLCWNHDISVKMANCTPEVLHLLHLAWAASSVRRQGLLLTIDLWRMWPWGQTFAHHYPSPPIYRAVKDRPPLLTRLCIGKSLIFIQSVPLPFLRKTGCECRPSAFYCVLILGSIICCNICAVGRVTFTLILYAPKRSLPLAMDQRSRLL